MFAMPARDLPRAREKFAAKVGGPPEVRRNRRGNRRMRCTAPVKAGEHESSYNRESKSRSDFSDRLTASGQHPAIDLRLKHGALLVRPQFQLFDTVAEGDVARTVASAIGDLDREAQTFRPPSGGPEGRGANAFGSHLANSVAAKGAEQLGVEFPLAAQ